MKETFDLAIRVIAWGLIFFVILTAVLMLLGVIHSPDAIDLNTLLTTGIILELGRLETKIGLIWDDFKRKKKM